MNISYLDIEQSFPLIKFTSENIGNNNIGSKFINTKIVIHSKFDVATSQKAGYEHEICHFVESDINNIFKDNWGLGGTDYPSHNIKSFNKMQAILEREIRVNCFQENVFGNDMKHELTFRQNMINYVSLLYNHDDNFVNEINLLSEYAGKYWDECIYIYTIEKFDKDFQIRYNSLSKLQLF